MAYKALRDCSTLEELRAAQREIFGDISAGIEWPFPEDTPDDMNPAHRAGLWLFRCVSCLRWFPDEEHNPETRLTEGRTCRQCYAREVDDE